MPEQIIRPAAAASGRVTPASFPFYTTGEDNLRVTSWNAATGVSLKINGRLLDSAGKANADSWDHTPNTDRSAKVTELALSGSTLLNLTVFANAGAPLMGQTFVKVELIRGLGAAAIVLGTILQSYVTATQAIGWPGSPIQTSVDSGGYYRAIIGTQPSAGGQVFETVPVGARWELIQFKVQFSTNATAVSRFVQFVANIGGSSSIEPWPDVASAASTVTKYYASAAPKQASTFDGTATFVSWPIGAPCILQSGNFFGTQTVNMQLGDQFLSPRYLVREWLEP